MQVNDVQPMLANTAGEFEIETRSRKHNVIEAFATMTYCLVVLWVIQYPFGVLADNKFALNLSTWLLFAGALYLLFVSPRIHHDTLKSWGLGNPMDVWRTLTQGEGVGRWATLTAVLSVTIGLTSAGFVLWPEVAKFIFGMGREAAAGWKTSIIGCIAVCGFCLLLATFISTCVIRYDNFGSAFLTAIKVLASLAIPLYLLAYLVMGKTAFADFHAAKFSLDVFGYIFWGAIQQLLFSSYFGTRFRKGFAPVADSSLRNRKRFLVALLNGSFFGMIHINSWSLVLVCWILGVVLSWVFMEDRNRNLIALGFIHGFLGSSVGWLFSKEKAGGFKIDMGVGPTHMHAFDPITVTLTIGLIIAFVISIVYIARTWNECEE